MIREPYNLNPYNSTIDTSKVNNFSFTFSGDELGSWNIEIAKNNTSPEIVYTSEEFVPEDVGYTHIYDGDIVEGITLPSTIAHSQGDDGLLRRLYSINGYPFNAAVVKLNVNGIENIGSIKGSTANGYLVATNYSLGRTGSNVTITGFDKDGTTIGSQVTDGTYDFLGYLLSVKANSNIQVGQAVQIEGNSFIIGSIADAGDGYSELTIVNGEATISDVTPILTFDSLAEADVTELTVGIEPVQDLNGYEAPWIGGGNGNIWDEEWEIGGIGAIGQLMPSVTDRIRSKNYIPVSPNTTYYRVTSVNVQPFFYKSDETFISYGIWGKGNFTTPAETALMKFQVDPAYGTTYNHDLGINYPSTVTTYFPYSNICPITGHDEVTVTRTGKNLLDTSTATVSGITFTQDNEGRLSASPNNSDPRPWGYANSQYKVTLPKGSYTIVTEVVAATSSTSSALNIFSRDGKVLVNRKPLETVGIKTASFTLDEETPIGVMTKQYDAVYRMMIVASGESTATAYEPYQGSTYTASLGQTVYGGTLDMVTGVLTVDKATITFSTTQGWTGAGSSGHRNFYYPLNAMERLLDYRGSMMCNEAAIARIGGDSAVSNMPVWVSGYREASLFEGQNWLYFHYDGIEDITALGNIFSASPLQVVYPLAKPIEITLTPQQIKTLVGTNNVWASSGQIVSIKFAYETN